LKYIYKRVKLKLRKGIAILSTGLALRVVMSKGSGSWMRWSASCSTGGKKHLPKHLRKLRLTGAEIASYFGAI